MVSILAWVGLCFRTTEHMTESKTQHLLPHFKAKARTHNKEMKVATQGIKEASQELSSLL